MTNSVKGEVTINRGDGKTPLTLALTFNALVSLEDELNTSINEIANSLADSNRFRLGLLRKVFAAALREKHPEITDADAGKFIQEIGIAVAMEKMQETVRAAFPNPQSGAQQKKK